LTHVTFRSDWKLAIYHIVVASVDIGDAVQYVSATRRLGALSHENEAAGFP
jgi:hypothetical protein